jgi:hypothetical protein
VRRNATTAKGRTEQKIKKQDINKEERGERERERHVWCGVPPSIPKWTSDAFAPLNRKTTVSLHFLAEDEGSRCASPESAASQKKSRQMGVGESVGERRQYAQRSGAARHEGKGEGRKGQVSRSIRRCARLTAQQAPLRGKRKSHVDDDSKWRYLEERKEKACGCRLQVKSRRGGVPGLWKRDGELLWYLCGA